MERSSIAHEVLLGFSCNLCHSFCFGLSSVSSLCVWNLPQPSIFCTQAICGQYIISRRLNTTIITISKLSVVTHLVILRNKRLLEPHFGRRLRRRSVVYMDRCVGHTDIFLIFPKSNVLAGIPVSCERLLLSYINVGVSVRHSTLLEGLWFNVDKLHVIIAWTAFPNGILSFGREEGQLPGWGSWLLCRWWCKQIVRRFCNNFLHSLSCNEKVVLKLVSDFLVNSIN